jgi:hypothetical protein
MTYATDWRANRPTPCQACSTSGPSLLADATIRVFDPSFETSEALPDAPPGEPRPDEAVCPGLVAAGHNDSLTMRHDPTTLASMVIGAGQEPS